MKLICIKRKTKTRVKAKKMGVLLINVTHIKKHSLSIPYRTLHKYRDTYYGKIKDCETISLTN